MSDYGKEEAVSLRECYSEKQFRQFDILLGERLFVVVNIKLWHCEIPWNVPPRNISDNFMLIVKEGCIQFDFKGKSKTLYPGDVQVVPEFSTHSYHLGAGCRSAEIYILHILCDYPEKGNPFLKLKNYSLSMKYKQAALSELRRITSFRNISKEKALLGAESFVRNFFFEQIEESNMDFDLQISQDSRLLRALDFMHQNLAVSLSVSDIAASIGLHEVWFRKLFSQTFHCSPLQELNRMRLMQALRMLSRGQESIGIIAQKCGFNSAAYFCLVFRKYFNMTPEKFRSRHLN